MVDVLIVGAGPAGLFAALELSKSRADILVIDQGKDISDRVCPMKKRDTAFTAIHAISCVA